MNNQSDIKMRLATAEDASAIHNLMARAQAALPCKDFFVISSEERVAKKLRENSFAYVAGDDGALAAYYIFMMPGLDPEENLGYDVGLGESELRRVLCMDSVAVDPAYRGMGLQRRLCEMGEAEGVRRGFDVFMATVDPRNTPSLRNFILSGYDIVAVREGYYQPGVPRALLMKRADGRKMVFESVGEGLVL